MLLIGDGMEAPFAAADVTCLAPAGWRDQAGRPTGTSNTLATSRGSGASAKPSASKPTTGWMSKPVPVR